MLQAEYKYNVLGQQVWRKLHPSGQIIHSLFDLEGNRIAEYDYDAVADTSTLIREYIWMDWLPVAVVEGGVTYFVRVDRIGRPVFATDSVGTIVWEAKYLPFGEVLATTGTPMELRFPGQWFQSESGLHQNWMRDYDPTTGRYLQADPLGLVDGASVYGYARQNPGRYTDLRGEQTTYGPHIPFTSPSRLPFSYDPRTWLNHPTDPYHHFPESFDPHVWYEGYGCTVDRLNGSILSMRSSGPSLDWGYFECRCLDGALNGVEGRYEVGVRIPTIFESPFGLGNRQPTVLHRNFRPWSTLR